MISTTTITLLGLRRCNPKIGALIRPWFPLDVGRQKSSKSPSRENNNPILWWRALDLDDQPKGILHPPLNGLGGSFDGLYFQWRR